MVPLVPFCPTNPISPRSPIGPVSPRWPWWPLLPWRQAINEQACNVPTRAVVPVCLTIQTFNTGSPLDERLHLTPGVYHHGGELFNSLCKTTNWQTSESKRCILAPEQSELTNLLASFSSFSNFARFALLTLVEKIGQGCELTKTSIFSLASEWNLELPAETPHPHTQQSRRPGRSFVSPETRLTPVPFSALWTSVPLFTLRRAAQVSWKKK